ncbi:amidohydrolase [Bacterioplanoides sp.]|uniref:amidohydrolase n=1 Tax=Bacterioplanoides sp. TaxID=2066072 RepID=UPI003B5BD124
MKRVLLTAAAGLMSATLLSPLAGCASSSRPSTAEQNGEQPADRVLTDARVYSAVAGAGVKAQQAIAIRDGKIIYIGDEAGVSAFIGDDTIEQDVDGKLVMPGLIDSHTHAGLIALLANATPMPENLDKDGIVSWLKQHIEDNPELPYVFAGAWNVSTFGLAGPHKKDLDAVSKGIPVVLMDDSGHSAWLNSKALALLDNNDDLAPGLSFYVRDEQGEPTGWLKEMVMVDAIDKIHTPDETMPEVLEFFLGYLSAHGVTTMMDGGNMSVGELVYPTLKQLDEAGRLPLRYEGVHHIYDPQQLDTAVAELVALRKKYQSDNIHFNTIKIHFDGVMEIRTAAMLEGYNDQPHNKGRTIVSEQRLYQLMKQGNAEKIDFHIHTVGDAAIRTSLNAYERLKNELGDQLYSRMTLAHLEYIHPQDIKRFQQLGVIANFTPQWHGGYFELDYHALGERQKRRMVVQPLLDEKAIVAFSSDVVTPDELTRANPFLGMQVAHNRQDIEGGEDAAVMEPLSDRLKLTDLIDGYTRGSAYQLRLEAQEGTLQPGKEANLVVMRDDILEMDRYDIHNAKVAMTIRQGQVVYERDFGAIVEEWLFELLYQ